MATFKITCTIYIYAQDTASTLIEHSPSVYKSIHCNKTVNMHACMDIDKYIYIPSNSYLPSTSSMLENTCFAVHLFLGRQGNGDINGGSHVHA